MKKNMIKKIFILLVLFIPFWFITCEDTTKTSNETYTITFDPNGGTGGPTTATVKFGEAMPALSEQAPVFENNIFTGYFDSQDSGIKYYNADLSSARNWDKKKDDTLYAGWVPPLGTITTTSSIVSIVQSTKANATELNYNDIKSLVEEAITLAGGLGGIVKTGDTVVLKPNLVSNKDFTRPNWQGDPLPVEVNGVCTDYRVVKAISEILRTIIGPTGKIWVMEGAGSDTTQLYMTYFKYTAADMPEVDEFISLESDSGSFIANNAALANIATTHPNLKRVQLDEFFLKGNHTNGGFTSYAGDGVFYVNKRMAEADVLINIPTLKNHFEAVYTGNIKNIGIGATPANVYGNTSSNVNRTNRVPHISTHSHAGLHAWIADYYAALPAHFVIVDALQGMQNGPTPAYERNGSRVVPFSAQQKNMRSILASRDGLAIDVVGANITNWDFDDIPYLQHLTESGRYGKGEPKDITIIGNKKVDDIRSDFDGIIFSVGPTGPGRLLNTEQRTPPSLEIISAVFEGQNLKVKLDTSDNTVKVDIFINGEYTGSVKDNLNEFVVDTTGMANGSHSLMIRSFSRYFFSDEKTITIEK